MVLRARKPRRRLLPVAVGLSVLMPGLGQIYCGRVRAGLAVWGAVLAVWCFCLLVWTRWLFAPVMPALVLGLAWGALQLVLIADLVRTVRAQAPTYELRPLNHAVAYLSIFLGLGVLPVGGGWLVVTRVHVGSLEVHSTAMFPHLLPGDRVLFDRTAFAEQPPRLGELVVVDGPQGTPIVARVVAGAGQVVQLREGRIVVDGQALTQGALEHLRVARFGPRESLQLASLEGFIEGNRGRSYIVMYDKERPVRLEPAPVELGPGEVYVAGDNRDAAVTERWHGRVRVDVIHGQPRCIWASRDEAGLDRPGRAGLEIH